ncbi:hypothetical protein EVAR_28882_1 [Eumeta japonica]|uniref:Uncharacterized protein n=1 Tax=Eumeta variegata TaxID=151549 RepID=A0A4C1X036_EUMVA|nr:hypothetical protein EVAR_28882_1 [Eumeta japonica]
MLINLKRICGRFSCKLTCTSCLAIPGGGDPWPCPVAPWATYARGDRIYGERATGTLTRCTALPHLFYFRLWGFTSCRPSACRGPLTLVVIDAMTRPIPRTKRGLVGTEDMVQFD